MLHRSYAMVLPALTSLVCACGPSLEAIPGRDTSLAWNELASLKLDDGKPEQTREDAPADRCVRINSFTYDAAIEQVTMRSCNGKGVPETEAFRLGEFKKDQLSGNLERLRLRKLNSPMQVCIQAVKGFSRIVVEEKAGNRDTFAAVESFTPGVTCDAPETINGVFEGAELTRIIADFEKMARRS